MNQWYEQHRIDKWRYNYLSGYKVSKLRMKQLKWIKHTKKEIKKEFDESAWKVEDEQERLQMS